MWDLTINMHASNGHGLVAGTNWRKDAFVCTIGRSVYAWEAPLSLKSSFDGGFDRYSYWVSIRHTMSSVRDC